MTDDTSRYSQAPVSKTLGSTRCRRLAAWGVPTVCALAFVSAVLAAPHPQGKFARFEDCPLARQKVVNCVYSVTTGGNFTIGRGTVPLTNPVTIQGGFAGAGSKIEFFGAENGETLSQAPQPVPGGLNGVVAPGSWPGWLQEGFNGGIEDGQGDVTATLELAAPPTSIELSTENLLFKSGTALGLPVKVKLENPLLGGNCYIGSDEHPIQLDLTTGKSGSVEGSTGKPSRNAQSTFSTFSGGRLVSNTFSTPGARGCGGIFSFFFDPLVDSLLGTPAGSGQNTAVLKGDFHAAAASAVRASE